jgi:competence protein ComFC
MFADLLAGVRELVFPDNCVLCRTFLNTRHSRQLCGVCMDTIKRNVPPFCLLCSRHLGHYSDDGLCPSCRNTGRHYDRVWAACFYDETIRSLLHSFKYNGKTALRKTLFELIRGFVDTYHVPVRHFDAVVPIPLHAARLRERGFNQSAYLSQALCAHYGLNHVPELLQRSRPTGAQALLDQKQRWTNVEGAFKMNPSMDATEKSILLVDDLMTTGSTANAAAACLKHAGAAHVGVLTLAITETET